MVRPTPSPETIGLQHVMVVEPLELEILAALAGADDKVTIADMILEKEDYRDILHRLVPDMLCITGYITHIPGMIRYCRIAKEENPAIQTVAGGVHVEKFPEVIDDDSVDFRVVRNATRVFPVLLEHIRNPSLQPVPPGVLKKGEVPEESALPEFDFYYPLPRRDLTRKYRNHYYYVFHDKVALIKTSFGCPYQCTFCFCRKITGGRYFERPLEEVITELKAIEEKEIYIVDDDFLISETRVRKFLQFLRENSIRKKFLVYGRADFIARHPEIIRDFKKLGLRTVIVGLESFFDNELAGFNKDLFATANEAAMKVLNKNGVDCYAAIILSPGWGKEDFRQLTRKLVDMGIRFVNLQPLTPLPGTDLPVKEEDLIVTRQDYARWDLAHVTLRPERMSVEEYYRCILSTYRRVIYQPAKMISYLKYPLRMQLRLALGIRKVRRQYVGIISESVQNG